MQKKQNQEQSFTEELVSSSNKFRAPMSSQSPRHKGSFLTMEHYNKMKSFQKILLMNGEHLKLRGNISNSFKFNTQNH